MGGRGACPLGNLAAMDQNDLRAKILAIHNDPTLSDAEKAKKRQELLSGAWMKPASTDEPSDSQGADFGWQPTLAAHALVLLCYSNALPCRHGCLLPCCRTGSLSVSHTIHLHAAPPFPHSAVLLVDASPRPGHTGQSRLRKGFKPGHPSRALVSLLPGSDPSGRLAFIRPV